MEHASTPVTPMRRRTRLRTREELRVSGIELGVSDATRFHYALAHQRILGQMLPTGTRISDARAQCSGGGKISLEGATDAGNFSAPQTRRDVLLGLPDTDAHRLLVRPPDNFDAPASMGDRLWLVGVARDELVRVVAGHLKVRRLTVALLWQRLHDMIEGLHADMETLIAAGPDFLATAWVKLGLRIDAPENLESLPRAAYGRRHGESGAP